MDRVDSYDTDRVGSFLVLLGRDIAATFLYGELYFEGYRRLHVAYLDLGVEHLETVEVIVEVASLESGLTVDGERHFLVGGIFYLTTETHLFEVKYDVGHILNDTGDRGELMLHTVDTNRCDGKTLEGREKDTPQGVAYGHTITVLQRAEFEHSTEVIGFEHDNLVGFLKS